MNVNTRLQLRKADKFLTPKLKEKPIFNHSLEGLRGFAAILVMSCHVLGFENGLDPAYTVPKYLHYFHAAHGAVLIFFILSGYVIGITNTQKFSVDRAVKYCWRRIIRLVPIYWIAIIITVILSPTEPIKNVVGNMLFLQNLWVPILSGNIAVWTLNYEMIYYLLFLLIWAIKPNVLGLLFACFSLSVAGWFMPTMPQFFADYAAGWIFWIIGLWLAWKIKPSRSHRAKVPLISYLLLLVATDHLNSGKVLLNGIGFTNTFAGAVNLSDLFLLPICLLLFIEVSQRRFKGYKILVYLSFALPILNVIFLLFIGRIFGNIGWIVSEICLLLAIIFWRFEIQIDLLTKLAPLGRISYGTYILHLPMMILVHNYFPYQGTALSFCLRFVWWLVLTIGISGLLELIMQPAIKKFCYQKLIYRTVL